MSWMQSPFAWMCILNVAAGGFSAIAGLKKAISEGAPMPTGEGITTANPWLYVLGGSLTVLVGIGNAFQLTIATLGTVVFILTSIYDGWFGPGSKDWRFYTLTAYAVVQSVLVIWSTQVKDILSFP